MLTRLLCLLIGYCFGLFQTAFLYGKTKGVDIRKVGSGNSGTTNALRNFGAKAGLIVLVGDVTKCILAFLLASKLFGGGEIPAILCGLYAGAGAILGHCFPFYMQFRGGKGIASMAGLIGVFSWKLLLIGFAIFALIFFTTHYVSLGSLIGALMFFVGTIILGQMGEFGVSQGFFD